MIAERGSIEKATVKLVLVSDGITPMPYYVATLMLLGFDFDNAAELTALSSTIGKAEIGRYDEDVANVIIRKLQAINDKNRQNLQMRIEPMSEYD